MPAFSAKTKQGVRIFFMGYFVGNEDMKVVESYLK